MVEMQVVRDRIREPYVGLVNVVEGFVHSPEAAEGDLRGRRKFSVEYVCFDRIGGWT